MLAHQPKFEVETGGDRFPVLRSDPRAARIDVRKVKTRLLETACRVYRRGPCMTLTLRKLVQWDGHALIQILQSRIERVGVEEAGSKEIR